jgi:alpha-mannosidase
VPRLPACIAVLFLSFGIFAVSASAAEPQLKRNWTVYLLPHSHVDIGYTHLQPEVERIQWRNIDTALELCRKTADYPPEARFKWNTEVLWAVDSYLREAPPEKQEQLIAAVRAGQIELQAFYGNELTGLCRPEELLRLSECSQRLAKRCGVKIQAAMISDVPGYTWGTVPALAQAGVKYFSIGPNTGARIGRTQDAWADKPFYWLGPDGREKILCYCGYMGYAYCHVHQNKLEPAVPARLAELERNNHPYDIALLRWCYGGDNGPPDVALPETVKKWNAEHQSPKVVIATAAEALREFERRYGDKIPEYRGDWTPYWEDGAGSSARETALARTASERLAQAETLWAMLSPRWYPTERFSAAWRNVLLYNEHTWGHSDSINLPDLKIVADTWRIKQAFANDADAQSRELLATAAAGRGAPERWATKVDVFNTSSWPRTDLIVMPKIRKMSGDVVLGPDGRPVPSQRLANGDLAFLAENVPPLAGRRYSIAAPKPGKLSLPQITQPVTIDGEKLSGPTITLRVDPATGALASFRGVIVLDKLKYEIPLSAAGGVNSFHYVLDDKVNEAKQSGPAKITIKESGPLVASLLVESDAPGCNKLVREYRLVAGLDRLEIINTVDKQAVRAKESVHFGFAFDVPEARTRIDIPWAVFQPDEDQLPAACKNWLCVGRWADVSNDKYGVSWATLDAPLMELGAITAVVMGEGKPPYKWLDKLAPSATFYSWAMNNHWFTNYRAEQSGPTVFRYAIMPHGQYDPIAAQRFGIECSQPLVAVGAEGPAPDGRPLVELDSPDVIVAALKPSNDREALIVRLFAAAGRETKVNLSRGGKPLENVWLSNLAEERVSQLAGPLELPAWGMATLRVENIETTSKQ